MICSDQKTKIKMIKQSFEESLVLRLFSIFGLKISFLRNKFYVLAINTYIYDISYDLLDQKNFRFIT